MHQQNRNSIRIAGLCIGNRDAVYVIGSPFNSLGLRQIEKFLQFIGHKGTPGQQEKETHRPNDR